MKKYFLLSLLTVLTLTACAQTQAPSATNPSNNRVITTNPLQDKPAPTATFATSLILVSSPASSVKVGEEVIVTVGINDAQEGVTTANTVLQFDPKNLEAVKVDTSDSSFPLAFRNETDNTKGTVTISRSNSEGVAGNNIVLAKVVFRSLQKGSATVKLDPDNTIVLLKNNADVTPKTMPEIVVAVE